ncbi:MAG: hypothetical protein AB7T63_06870 [Planctomycetota bacterium]
MRRASAFLAVLLVGLLPTPGSSTHALADEPAPAPVAAPPQAEAPESPPVVASEAVGATRASIERGAGWLGENQNKNGSWGSSASNLWDIYAPPPGSQQAFQTASVALALSGLLENRERLAASAEERARIDEQIERATVWLLDHHAIRRIRADTLYNTWALSYALEAFARLLERKPAPERRAQLREGCERCIDLLERFEFAEGGWGYYNFDAQTRRPGPGATSFTTATALIAMHRAAQQGVSVPERLVERGKRIIRLSWRPDNAFYYSPDHRLAGARMGVNQVKGSLARTPTCLLALELWGEPVPAAKWRKCFEDLEEFGHFLRIARKYPIPHETWYQNSGYFCLYGYYYAAMSLRFLPADVAREHADRIAFHVRGMQEKDGSTWDYQLFQFHKAYGTGYSLLALDEALDVLERPQVVADDAAR